MSLTSPWAIWLAIGITIATALIACYLTRKRGGVLRKIASFLGVVLVSVALACSVLLCGNISNHWVDSSYEVFSYLGSRQAGHNPNGVVTPLPPPQHTITATPSTSHSQLHNFHRSAEPNIWDGHVHGVHSGLDFPVRVWVPPTYYSSPKAAVNVVILLQGFPGTGRANLRTLDINRSVPQLIRQDIIAPTIYVAPDLSLGGVQPDCVDLMGHPPVETALTRDLVQAIRGTFPDASQHPNHWILAGVSSGGYCAPVLYLRHQDMFYGAISFSGYDRPLLGGLADATADVQKQFTITSLAQQTKHHPLHLYLVGSTNDPDSADFIHGIHKVVTTGDRFQGVIQANGGHSNAMWAEELPHSLRWWASGIRATSTDVPSDSAIQLVTTHASRKGLFGPAGWGTLAISLITACGSIFCVVRYGPPAQPATSRAQYLRHLLGRFILIVVAAIFIDLFVLFIFNHAQGFVSTWGDALADIRKMI